MAGYTRLEDLRSAIFGTTLEKRYERIQTIGRLVVHRWGAEASKRLKKTLAPYLASLDKELTENSVVISLPGKDAGRHAFLARVVEFGFGAGGIGTYSSAEYDMRLQGQKLLSRTPNAKGRIVIPFHFSRSEASDAAGGDIDKIFNKQAGRGQRFSVRVSDRTTLWGARLPASLGRKLKPYHENTTAAGMVNAGVASSRSGKIRSGGFTTFRTVPKIKKDPMSWMTKGIAPRDIARRFVVPAIPEMLKDAGII